MDQNKVLQYKQRVNMTNDNDTEKKCKHISSE